MPVKFALCSDLHADTTPANDLLPKLIAEHVATLGVDALIICGDLSAQKVRFETALQELRRAGCPIGFVPGNQDAWLLQDEVLGPWEDSWTKLDWVIETCNAAGVKFLGDWDFNGELLILGTIGWYDYSFASPDLEHVIGANAYEDKYIPGVTWLDAEHIKWGVPDRDVAASFNHEFNERLAHHAKLLPPNHRATLITTHMVPFVEGVTYKRDLKWDFTAAFMGSRGLGDAILEHAIPLNITNVFFGHTHIPRTFAMGGVRCACAPFGYYPKLPADEGAMMDIVRKALQVIVV